MKRMLLSALKKQAGAQFLIRDKSRIFVLPAMFQMTAEVYFESRDVWRGIEKEASAVAE